MSGRLYVKGVRVRDFGGEDDYFTEIPTITNLKDLRFDSPITFFVGENGSGKSTLLEGIAVAFGFNAEGGSLNFNFATSETHSRLHEYLTVIKAPIRPKDGFFLRAESFYNVATEIDRFADQRFLERNYGGKSLHHQSHGESFLNLVKHRFWGNGLYILDEPEAALSPQRQLALMVALKELVEDGSQFIIATHSPILLAMPEAKILSFDEGAIREINYEETEHFQVTELIVNQRESVFRNLF